MNFGISVIKELSGNSFMQKKGITDAQKLSTEHCYYCYQAEKTKNIDVCIWRSATNLNVRH